MNLVKFNPFRELQPMHPLMDSLLNNRPFPGVFEEDRLNESHGSTTVDVYENENEFVVSAELPGFEQEDINISLNDGRLTVTGEREFEKKENEEYHRVERWYDQFHRSFQIPGTVDAEKIKAELNSGVLTVAIPKKEEVKPRQIPISVS